MFSKFKNNKKNLLKFLTTIVLFMNIYIQYFSMVVHATNFTQISQEKKILMPFRDLILQGFKLTKLVNFKREPLGHLSPGLQTALKNAARNHPMVSTIWSHRGKTIFGFNIITSSDRFPALALKYDLNNNLATKFLRRDCFFFTEHFFKSTIQERNLPEHQGIKSLEELKIILDNETKIQENSSWISIEKQQELLTNISEDTKFSDQFLKESECLPFIQGGETFAHANEKAKNIIASRIDDALHGQFNSEAQKLMIHNNYALTKHDFENALDNDGVAMTRTFHHSFYDD